MAEAEGHAELAQVTRQHLDDLGIDEIEQRLAAVHERHGEAEVRHHARVLETDDPRADDDARLRELAGDDVQQLVGVMHVRVVVRDAGLPGRSRPAPDQDVLGLDDPFLDGQLGSRRRTVLLRRFWLRRSDCLARYETRFHLDAVRRVASSEAH